MPGHQGRSRALFPLVVVLALALAACGSSSKSSSGSSGATTAGSASSGSTTLRLGYFPNVDPHAGAHRRRGRQVRGRRWAPSVKLDLKTFNSGSEAVTAILAGALDASFVGPNPAINAYQKTNGKVRIVAGTASGGAYPRREADDQQRRRPEGQEGRVAATRQHAGRRAAYLAERQRPARDQERRRRHDRAAGELGDAHRVRARRDRRRVGSRAVGDSSRATKAAARCSSTRRRSGRRVSTRQRCCS